MHAEKTVHRYSEGSQQAVPEFANVRSDRLTGLDVDTGWEYTRSGKAKQ